LFSLSDNGIGIADEFVDKVFAIFQRLHGRDDYAGPGIGLALVKKIVDYHGGSIWIDTSYGGGTRLRFTLPVAHDGEEGAAPLVASSRDFAQSRHRAGADGTGYLTTAETSTPQQRQPPTPKFCQTRPVTTAVLLGVGVIVVGTKMLVH
jgi:Histidine kinase-, DNA gyrase B-, and HSP90-like ATPase